MENNVVEELVLEIMKNICNYYGDDQSIISKYIQCVIVDK